MSSDIQYSVEVAFLTSGNFTAPLSSLKSKVGDLGREFSHFGVGALKTIDSAMSSIGTKIVETVGTAALAASGALVLGLGHAVKEGLDFNAYIESSVNGIAATLAMLGDIPLNKGLQQANAAAEQLRKNMASLPGEFSDGMAVLNSIMPAMTNGGQSMDQAVWMASHAVAAAAALNVPMQTAARELGKMLDPNGHVTTAMPLFTRMGLGSAKDWNKLSGDERFNRIQSSFKKLDPAMANFQGSWEGMTSTARDNARNVAKTFAQPLFGSIKGQFERSLAWFSQNEDYVHGFANNLGVYIDRAFHGGLNAIHRWFAPVTTFGHNLGQALSSAFHTVEPYLERFESVATKFLSSPDAVGKLMHGASMLVAAKAGTSALANGASAMSGMGSLLGTAGLSGAELATMAGPAAVAIIGLGVAAEGAVHALTDASSAYHASAINSSTEIVASGGKLAYELAALDAATREVRDGLGAAFLGWLSNGVGQLTLHAEAANKGVEAIESYNEAARDAGTKLRHWLGLSSDRDLVSNQDQMMADLRAGVATSIAETFTATYSPLKALADATADSGKEAKRKVPQTHVNVGKVEIRIDGADDPRRVAVTVEDTLRRLGRSRNGEASNPNNAYLR